MGKRIGNTFIIVFLFISCVLMSSCKKDIKGCIDSTASNFNSTANTDDGSCVYYHIGKILQGGIIFYIDGSGAHGLISSTSDIVDSVGWDTGQSIVTGASATAVGTGKTNSALIITTQGIGNYAAYLCKNFNSGGYTDWFLPSKEELILMYNLRTNIGNFSNGIYWSSSEISNYTAWAVDFSGGNIVGEKTSLNRVRAIRAF